MFQFNLKIRIKKWALLQFHLIEKYSIVHSIENINFFPQMFAVCGKLSVRTAILLPKSMWVLFVKLMGEGD